MGPGLRRDDNHGGERRAYSAGAGAGAFWPKAGLSVRSTRASGPSVGRFSRKSIVARRMRDGGRGSAVDQADGIGTLTARERDVLARVARGYPNRQIASDLGITERTARTHVSNILAKLGLTSRTQAALLAAQHGLDREA